MVEVIPGDITEPNFGMGEAEFNELAMRIDGVYHSAASTDLNPSLEEARRSVAVRCELNSWSRQINC